MHDVLDAQWQLDNMRDGKQHVMNERNAMYFLCG